VGGVRQWKKKKKEAIKSNSYASEKTKKKRNAPIPRKAEQRSKPRFNDEKR